MLRIRLTCLRAWVLSGVLAVSLAAVAAFPSTARAAEPIKIGFSMTLTGGLAANGKAALVAMEIWRDETFAPILYVFEYETLDEALELHNSVDQGLSSSIFTTRSRRAPLDRTLHR